MWPSPPFSPPVPPHPPTWPPVRFWATGSHPSCHRWVQFCRFMLQVGVDARLATGIIFRRGIAEGPGASQHQRSPADHLDARPVLHDVRRRDDGGFHFDEGLRAIPRGEPWDGGWEMGTVHGGEGRGGVRASVQPGKEKGKRARCAMRQPEAPAPPPSVLARGGCLRSGGYTPGHEEDGG